MQKDPWIFNYRSHYCDDSDSDSDHSLHGSKSKISDESRLRSELDISTRPDAAVFKPNPFSIAKMNAFTRSSRPVVAKPARAVEKPKNTGTIDAFFCKTVRKKPAACMERSTPGGRNLTASSQMMPTSRHHTEKRPSKPPESCTDRYLNSSDKSKPNVVKILSNCPPQVNTNLTRYNSDLQRVFSSRNVPHTPVRSCVHEEASLPVYAKVCLPQNACSGHQATMHGIRPGKENQLVVPLEDEYPPVPASHNPESPPPIILSINREERGSVSFKPDHGSGVTFAVPSEMTARCAPMKRLASHPKVDSLAHISASTARDELKCYEAQTDEDESWSTLPPRKKSKPSVQPMSKYKMTGPFRIPGLRNDGNGVKTGMSATSSSRVITFLPTPLVLDSHKGGGKNESLSSPRSSPQSHHYSNFSEESGGTPYSSPATSDAPEADCDLNIRWDTHRLEERYAQVPKAIEEHRRSKQLIWNLLGLDSNCYVYRDDGDVQTEVRIVLWRG